jgi:hypothetical protein
MLTLKSQVTCSHCSKIYKDPILLPCEDSICGEHLSERSVVNQNKIKCKKCSEEFQVKGHEFKSNIELMKLLESHSYLSEEEIELKRELEECIQKFYEFYDEFSQNRTKLDMDVYNHFQEIRFQIDEHREELKKRIDDIALAMIDATKKCQEKYLRDLKENYSSFDGRQSLEDKLNDIEDTFRNPSLLIQSIREMQKKQEESLRDIQFGGFTTVSWDSSDRYKSDANAFLFSLTNKDNKPVKMNIHSNQHQYLNQHECAIFCHSECGPTFGGGHDISIKNTTLPIQQYTIYQYNNTTQNIYNPNTTMEGSSRLGSSYSLPQYAYRTMNSCSQLGYYYNHPKYEEETNEANSFLAGSHKFQLDEIEVYQKEKGQNISYFNVLKLKNTN